MSLPSPLHRGNPRLSDPVHRSRLRYLRAQLCLDGPWSVRKSYWLDAATIAHELISPPRFDPRPCPFPAVTASGAGS